MESENKNLPATQQATQLKSLLSAESTKKRFSEILGKKAPGFISSIISAVNGSAELQKCIPETIIGAAAIAASLDLPIVQGLGFAGIVPFYNSKKQCTEGQFQIFKKGFIQLAQRSGQVKTIHAGPVYEGQLKNYNPFTGDFEFDAEGKTSEKIVGYVAFVRFINGFEKYRFMTIPELEKHAKKYSASYRKGFGKWADKTEGGFEQMCEKTVLKLLLSNYAPLSIEMQNAIVYDQSAITDTEHHYIDSPAPDSIDIDKTNEKKERDRILSELAKCTTFEEIEILEHSIGNFADYNVNAEFEEAKKKYMKGKK